MKELIVVLADGNTFEFKGEKARIAEMKIESAEKKKQTFTQDIRTGLNGRAFRININHILYMDKVEEGEEI